jgi:hypothetical protein
MQNTEIYRNVTVSSDAIAASDCYAVCVGSLVRIGQSRLFGRPPPAALRASGRGGSRATARWQAARAGVSRRCLRPPG